MSGKSKRKRGKQHSSRKMRGQESPRAVARVPAAPPTRDTTQPQVDSPPATVPTSPIVSPQAIRFPYITAELRTIGILAGIMLIVLIILYFTLV
jgi:hypothetical protein